LRRTSPAQRETEAGAKVLPEALAGILTASSGLLAWLQMDETLPRICIAAADSAPLRAVATTHDSATPKAR